MKDKKLRKTGIDVIGDAPWGTHFCLFYQTKEDLIDILVPYFKAGLENNEFCMWVTSQPLNVEAAKTALERAVENLDDCIERGQIELLDYSQWYTKSRRFDADEVLQGWVEKEDQAVKRGFDGLRLTGNTFWLEERDWEAFTDYEAAVNGVIGQYHMLAICTYSLDRCGAAEIMDVVSNHDFALIKREGKWDIIESAERKRAEEALRESTQLLQRMYDTIPDAILIHDAKLNIVSCNQSVQRVFGYTPNELIGKHYSILVSEEMFTDPKQKAREAELFEKGYLEQDGFLFKKKNGESFPGSFVVALLRDEEGNFAGTVGTARDITERKQAEEQLRATLRAKTALLQEVDHRVKNNLQVISSLLSMQASSTQDPQVIQALQDSGRRVRTMAMIHERLSLSPDLASIDAGRHLRTLVDYLIGAYGGWERDIITTVEVDEVSLDMDTAIPCSLIINELVSNALKHAFPAEGERPGGEDEIRVELRMAGDGELCLMVSDNGVGLPPEVDWRDPPSLGLQLVNMLTSQLEGTLEVDRRAGTTFKTTFAGPKA